MNPYPPVSARYKPHLPLQPRKGRHLPRVNSNVHPPINPPVQPPVNPPANEETQINPRFKNQPPLTYRDDPTPRLSPIIPNGPITPQETIEKYSSLLTRYETTEILNFPAIYYLGIRAKKREPLRNDHHNFGFDNSDNTYRLCVGDHLAYRFEVLSTFGSGAFGQVIKALDHKSGQQVAIKIVVNTDQMHEQGQIEAKILARLNKCSCPNVVRAYDFFIFRSHICITYEILGKNLYELIQANHYHPFPAKIVRTYAIQAFQALEGIHNAKIIHADIKPENILILSNTQRSQTKVIDFGSGCFEGHQKYEYIQSRFYRAPEVVLGIPYGPPMDIWSAALVIIELLIGKPLFPCNDEHELLWMITELLGPPPQDLILLGKRRNDFFDMKLNMKIYKGRSRKPSSVSLSSILKINDPYLIDFLTKCLTWDQTQRLTAKEALHHPWIQMKTVSIPDQVQQQQSQLPDLHNS